MANKYLSKDITNTVGYARPISRIEGTVLDASGFYPSLEDTTSTVDGKNITITGAETYAKSANAYVGQIINVVTDTDVTPYVIKNTNGDLKSLGGVENGDGKIKLVYDDTLAALKFVFE